MVEPAPGRHDLPPRPPPLVHDGCPRGWKGETQDCYGLAGVDVTTGRNVVVNGPDEPVLHPGAGTATSKPGRPAESSLVGLDDLDTTQDTILWALEGLRHSTVMLVGACWVVISPRELNAETITIQ